MTTHTHVQMAQATVQATATDQPNNRADAAADTIATHGAPHAEGVVSDDRTNVVVDKTLSADAETGDLADDAAANPTTEATVAINDDPTTDENRAGGGGVDEEAGTGDGDERVPEGLLQMNAANMSPDVLRLVGRVDEADAAEKRLAEDNASQSGSGWQPPSRSGLGNDKFDTRAGGGDGGGDGHDDLDRGGDDGGQNLQEEAYPHVEPTSVNHAFDGADGYTGGHHVDPSHNHAHDNYDDSGTPDSLVDDYDRFHEEHSDGVGFGVGIDDGIVGDGVRDHDDGGRRTDVEPESASQHTALAATTAVDGGGGGEDFSGEADGSQPARLNMERMQRLMSQARRTLREVAPREDVRRDTSPTRPIGAASVARGPSVPKGPRVRGRPRMHGKKPLYMKLEEEYR